MDVLGFSHYNLRATRESLDALCTFYTEVVGLRIGARPPFMSFGYWLYAGQQDVLHLTEAARELSPSIDSAASFDHAAFNCTGRREFESRLAQLGIAYRVANVPQTGQVQLFFRDPVGNGIELNFASTDI
jgi:catechol-2,3-dioxygenase